MFCQPLSRIDKFVVEWEEHGMGSIQGKCQIVRMLHNRQDASDAIHREDECWWRLVSPHLEHVEDHKGGKICEEPAEVPKSLEFYYFIYFINFFARTFTYKI
jgi:hypothetical protein